MLLLWSISSFKFTDSSRADGWKAAVKMMRINTENTQKMKKKFYRRTAIFTLLWCATFLNAVEDKLGYENIVRPFKPLGTL